MIDLSVMMKELAVDTKEKTCADCGEPIYARTGRVIRCVECQKAYDESEANHRYHTKERGFDPVFALTEAVITQARRDLHDRRNWGEGLDPREFIQNGGVQLWLKAVGIGVRPSMNDKIRKFMR